MTFESEYRILNNVNQGLKFFRYFNKALKGLYLNNRGYNPRLTLAS